MDIEEIRAKTKDVLTPPLTTLGGRWINAKVKREIYKIGAWDITSFAHRVTQLLHPDDPRYVGMAHISRYMQMLCDGIGMPKDPNAGVEAFSRDKPIPLPQGHIDELSNKILDDLMKPTIGAPKMPEGG